MPSAYANTAADLGAVSLWMLGNDGSGNINLTDAIGSNHLTKTSGTHALLADSQIVGETHAASFDGSTWLNKSAWTGVDLEEAHSMACWIRYGALNSGWGWVVATTADSIYNGLQLRSGFLSTRGEADGSNYGHRSSTTAVLNTWYFLAFTYDGSGTSKIYVNAVDQTGAMEGSANVGDATMITFGARDSGGVGGFTGAIQGAVLANQEWDAGDVAELMASAAQSLDNRGNAVRSGVGCAVYPVL